MDCRKKPDWRKKPRKPAEQKKCRSITIRVTEAELAAMTDRAAAAGMTRRDFIVWRALGKRGA